MSVNAVHTATTPERMMVSLFLFLLIATSMLLSTPNLDPMSPRFPATFWNMPRCCTNAAAVACACPMTSSTLDVELWMVPRSRMSCEPALDAPNSPPPTPSDRLAPPSRDEWSLVLLHQALHPLNPPG